MRRLASVLALFFSALCVPAHVGSPTVFYEGLAGIYAVRVVVRPPVVVPGLAEISVRILSGEARRVTVLPVRWDAGQKGAPPPDEAGRVPGETNLYSAELWLMTSGAHSIFVNVEGAAGGGVTVVPLNSVATTRRPMPRWMGGALLAGAMFLFVAFITLVGAAARESVLPPGLEPDRSRARRARFAMAGALVVATLALVGGQAWWRAVDANHRNNKLFRPDPMTASVRAGGGQRILSLERTETKWGQRPLVPEHGKLMHLFLVRQAGMDGFAHLHPVRVRTNTFEVALPGLPAGRYSAYADVTHESGFTQTLIAEVDLPEAAPEAAALEQADAPDPDDSWHVAAPAANQTSASALGGGLTMKWERPAALLENRETLLRFRVLDAAGQPAALEPYLGMQSHAVLRRDDGSVFTHLHPFGTISMASQQLFVKRERDLAPGRKTLEVVCGLPPADDFISFPYEFPKAGRYRLWVQVKAQGKILTGCFDAEVGAAQL